MRALSLVVSLLSVVPVLSLSGQTPATPQAESFKTFGPQPQAGWALWLTSFVGPAAVNDGSGSTGGFALSYQRARAVWSLRAQLGSDNQTCPSSDCGPEFGELALLYGYGTRAGRTLHASAGAGISIAGDDSSWAIGLPLEVQLNWRPTRIIGAGMYAWANSFGPSYGLGAAVHLGRLR